MHTIDYENIYVYVKSVWDLLVRYEAHRFVAASRPAAAYARARLSRHLCTLSTGYNCNLTNTIIEITKIIESGLEVCFTPTNTLFMLH